jgi:hypothetical protein
LPYEGLVRPRFLKACGAEGLAAAEYQRSHQIYGKTGSVLRLTIPIHGNLPLKKGLQRH